MLKKIEIILNGQITLNLKMSYLFEKVSLQANTFFKLLSQNTENMDSRAINSLDKNTIFLMSIIDCVLFFIL